MLPARARSGVGGFTLIEIILVITLIAFIYSVALPQFSLKTGAEIANKMSQIGGDIRNAYDLAVLSGKTYRLVIEFNSGDYWLEVADRRNVVLGDEKLDRDPTEEDEKAMEEEFANEFREYEDLAGDIVVDPEEDTEIPPVSPVLLAKDRLARPTWTRVNDSEWQGRSLGPYLLVKSMQAEHHGEKQELEDLGEKARGFIHFFPNGYIERAVIHVFYKNGDMTPDEDEEPYTIVTRSWEGTAEISAGFREVDVQSDENERT